VRKAQPSIGGAPLIAGILETLADKKGENIKALDVRDLVSYTDTLVLCTGNSTTHVSALVSALRQRFRGGDSPSFVNSSKDDTWWILDFVEVVVHVFQEDARRFYDLDQLWGDAKPLP